jgi:hypothetical protein
MAVNVIKPWRTHAPYRWEKAKQGGDMRGASASRCIGVICALVALAVLGSPAAAIEFWEDRVSIHGFYEQQIRFLGRDFNASDGWDLAQWYHILNLEIEAEIAPDGFGPFDLVSAFGRIEVRYDCVWSRACGIFSSADAYGDRAERLPKRVMHARRNGFSGTTWDGDTRRYREILPFERNALTFRNDPEETRHWVMLQDSPGYSALAGITGVDGVLNSVNDPYAPTDPFFYVFQRYTGKHCRFGNVSRKGSVNGVGDQVLPWDPACKIEPLGALMDRANPLRAGDINPISGNPGVFSNPFLNLPFHPAPNIPHDSRRLDPATAQGLWYPNQRLAQYIREGEFDSMDQEFRQEELEWNRGASQQDEKELKELYLDLELFDSRLWLRIGKQSIVWGKTELFRTTDQFNPQDLALASLPSLEESRIALWAVRAVWSFYNVGPLEDVRLELAMNYDQFEPRDLGRCGEPFAPLPVCNLAWGQLVHGTVQDGLAGSIRPPNPWNSWKGIEAGARLEWRYDRFSFAITDFYGFNDGPYADQIFRYSRNVDPRTGRPRVGMSTTQCKTGGEPACMTEKNALAQHSANQTRFIVICGAAVGFSSLDSSACGQTVFNSQNPASAGVAPTIAQAISSGISGQDPAGESALSAGGLIIALSTQLSGWTPSTSAAVSAMTRGYPYDGPLPGGGFGGYPTPLVPIVDGPNDGVGPAPGEHPQGIQFLFTQFGLSTALSDEQEALLGCGPFYHTNCDIQGIDLFNIEASAWTQSWSNVEGVFFDLNTTNGRVAQPGTTGFEARAICTRYEHGRTFILPGCRGPRDRGYDPDVDGTLEGDGSFVGLFTSNGRRVHPFTGQEWASEMAIVSWNAQVVLVALSFPEDVSNPQIDEFDASQPFRTGGCSFAQPYWCSAIRGIHSLLGVQRASIRAGGNGRYGRRDFGWHGGSDVLLRWEKRNVLGFSMDFAEDITKSNWGLEFTWIEGVPFSNNNVYDGNTEADTFNLTLSVDRPTFINFLNQNRTFFFNSQWFFQYVEDYVHGFTSNGPWNILATFTVTSGYFQDRLLPGVTFVYDFQSNSGAALPVVTYRFTENFFATFGVAGFWGRYEHKPAPLIPTALPDRVGEGANKSFVENGLSAVRERDEIFLRVRYTF